VTLTTRQTKVVMSVAWPDAPSAPLYRVVAGQTSGSPPYRFWQLAASEGFVSGGGDISLPDLSGVAGWDPGLELVAGSFVEWLVVAETGATLDELVRWYPTREGTVLADGFSGSQTPQ